MSTRVNYESFSNKHDGIDSSAKLSDGFTFKISIYEVAKEKQKESAGWFCGWQYFLTSVASFSLCFNGFQLESIYLNVHIGG